MLSNTINKTTNSNIAQVKSLLLLFTILDNKFKILFIRSCTRAYRKQSICRTIILFDNSILVFFFAFETKSINKIVTISFVNLKQITLFIAPKYILLKFVITIFLIVVVFVSIEFTKIAQF